MLNKLLPLILPYTQLNEPFVEFLLAFAYTAHTQRHIIKPMLHLSHFSNISKHIYVVLSVFEHLLLIKQIPKRCHNQYLLLYVFHNNMFLCSSSAHLPCPEDL